MQGFCLISKRDGADTDNAFDCSGSSLEAILEIEQTRRNRTSRMAPRAAAQMWRELADPRRGSAQFCAGDKNVQRR